MLSMHLFVLKMSKIVFCFLSVPTGSDENIHHPSLQMGRAGHLSREKELYSEESFYFPVLDDTPPEDSIPLVFPELDQQLQVRIFPESFFFPL